MKTHRLVLGVFLLTSFWFGCEVNSPSGPNSVTIADLAGSWTTTSIVYQSEGNPSYEFDAATLGEWREIEFNSDGSFEMKGAKFGHTYTQTGRARVENNKLFLGVAEDQEREYQLALEESNLTIIDENARAEFNGSGKMEPASETAMYVKD